MATPSVFFWSFAAAAAGPRRPPSVPRLAFPGLRGPESAGRLRYPREVPWPSSRRAALSLESPGGTQGYENLEVRQRGAAGYPKRPKDGQTRAYTGRAKAGAACTPHKRDSVSTPLATPSSTNLNPTVADRLGTRQRRIYVVLAGRYAPVAQRPDLALPERRATVGRRRVLRAYADAPMLDANPKACPTNGLRARSSVADAVIARGDRRQAPDR